MKRLLISIFILGLSLALAAELLRGRPRRAAEGPAEEEPPASTEPVAPVAATAAAPEPEAEEEQEEPRAGSAVADEALREALCPEDMLLVDGAWCPGVRHECEEEGGSGCRRFRKPIVCRTETRSLRFCIDRYEYPNLSGVRPAVMVTYHQAEKACEAEGKRLCADAEWTLACEGPAGLPLPYGSAKKDGACNTDQDPVNVPVTAFWDPRAVSGQLARVDRRAPSGAYAGCVSPYGVHDMVGNVEEWVRTDLRGRYVSALKGGDYAAAHARCRPTRNLSQAAYRLYQTGFRCCSDPLVRAR